MADVRRFSYLRLLHTTLNLPDENGLRRLRRKPFLCPQRLAARRKTSVPLASCPRSSGAERPSTEELRTAGAQQVNFVVRWQQLK